MARLAACCSIVLCSEAGPGVSIECWLWTVCGGVWKVCSLQHVVCNTCRGGERGREVDSGRGRVGGT